jgi:EXPERA (EXPanded EBP superfamily)
VPSPARTTCTSIPVCPYPAVIDRTDAQLPHRPRRPVPLGRRPVDLVLVAFFAVNLGVVTYVVDLEQLVIRDPSRFSYPVWPPRPVVDLVHWWGRNYDPLLLARPAFFRMTIWIDVLFFGPFYVAAIYAFVRGRDWIRSPALLWAGAMPAIVLIILMEERYGIHASPRFGMVLAANLPWLLFPLAVVARLARSAHPFTEVTEVTGVTGVGGVAGSAEPITPA